MGEIVFAVTRGNTAVTGRDYKLCRAFDPHQGKHSEGKEANLISFTRLSEGAAEILCDGFGNVIAVAKGKSVASGALPIQNVQSQSNRFCHLHYRSGKIGALVNGSGNGGTEGVGGNIRLKYRHAAFATVEKYAFVVNAKPCNVLSRSQTGTAVKNGVEIVADGNLKISLVEGHFLGLNPSSENFRVFNPNGGCRIQNGLSLIGNQNSHFLQTLLISARIINAVCINAAGAVCVWFVLLKNGSLAFGGIEHREASLIFLLIVLYAQGRKMCRIN
jgi:hypothetical protein